MSKHLNINHWNKRTFRIFVSALLAGAVLFTALGFPTPAEAHCDSYQGPVVLAARQALEKGDIKQVSPYVKAADQAELAAAFKQAREVRKLSPEAKKLADEFFFEVAVRLHREGEGAAYTGLKNEPVPPAIAAADKAMQTGDLKGVHGLLAEALEEGLAEKYNTVVEAREQAEKLGTEEAHRERVEAELIFEKYVYELYTLAGASEVHAEGTHSH